MVKLLFQHPRKTLFFCILIIICVKPFFCAALEVTGKELQIDLVNHFDRVFKYGTESSASFFISLNDIFKTGAGLSASGTDQAREINGFYSFRMGFNFLKPKFFKYLSANIFYLYDGLPDYETHGHSIIQAIGIQGGIAGITIGYHSRWTSFYNEKAIYEAIIAFSIYLRLLNVKMLNINLVWKNFDSFYDGNFGSYYLGLQSEITVNQNVSIKNDLNVYQSGSVGLSSVLYGFSLRSGVVIKW